MSLLKLQKSIVYGPVASRRLGCSLGVNVLPFEYKLCSLNCVYCQYGWTKEWTLDAKAHVSDLPDASDVRLALDEYLSKLGEIGVMPSYITFSGNGEPTLHPGFAEIVGAVKKSRDRLLPKARVAILSNSTTVADARTREALEELDVRIMKLDCADQGTYDSFNRPCKGVELSGVIEGLKSLGSFRLQTLLTNLNSSEESIARWVELVGRLKPSDVQIYTLDRQSPSLEVERLSKEKLEDIARLLERLTGVKARVY
ncbi:MAG: radical SAM protein [Candidatus Eisenbacteria bacterium]